MSVWFTWSINQASPGSSVLVSAAFSRSKYFYIVTLALNLLCTCKNSWIVSLTLVDGVLLAWHLAVLIGFRIWKINHRLKSHSAGLNRKDHVLSAILESGVSLSLNSQLSPCIDPLLVAAMYTASLIGLIGTSVADNSAMFLFLNAVSPSLSLSNNFLMVCIYRCHLLS